MGGTASSGSCQKFEGDLPVEKCVQTRQNERGQPHSQHQADRRWQSDSPMNWITNWLRWAPVPCVRRPRPPGEWPAP